MIYDFKKIEKYWQKYWEINKTFESHLDNKKLKFYILDMFPYPSGEGLHVGHLLGYIASDIYARYKRSEGYNVLHPIGFDSFGLPSEQYAIQTGQHPIETTKINIKRYKKQLKNIGISFDWSREINTSDPNYYKWTQWIFIQTFNSWYDKKNNKARPIIELIKKFEKEGNSFFNEKIEKTFTNKEWNKYSIYKKEEILKNYRLAFRSKSKVNWCPYLGTVLANDEVKNGKSERGGYPVFQKEIMQWHIRITAYADRLLSGLDKVNWPQSIKDSQKNWIGKSFGLDIYFIIEDDPKKVIHIFTTRPETIFGVTFIVLAPDNNNISYVTKHEYKDNVQFYIEKINKYPDSGYNIEKVSGEFTGTYVLHPFINKKLPVYISDYFLYDYGTGSMMGVPAHNKRDYNFAKKFNLDIIEVIYNKYNIKEPPYEGRIGKCINSYFINGLDIKNDFDKIKEIIEKTGIGKKKIKYKIRDAIFSRQRYWGEPIPIYYKRGVPTHISEDKLPLLLPSIDKYNICRKYNESPLSFANFWAWDEKQQKVVSNNLIDENIVFPIEINTMPGWAGSSWYFLRYMDPNNKKEFLSTDVESYWKNVDIYIGGAEHAIGHLIYARFWHKFFMDRGWITSEEPFIKLINQGMILGCSAILSRIPETGEIVSLGKRKQKNIQELHIDINLLKNEKEVDINKFKNWRSEFLSSDFILEDNKLFCKRKIEKMSKSKFNVIKPDDICKKYGADTIRMYEMFLGPISQPKIWNDNGIIGVYNFIKKFWRLFHFNGEFYVSKEKPSLYELKILHKTIKKIQENIESFSFNTSVSCFMISVNELTKLKCQKVNILTPLLILISPFIPHIAEEIWKKLGNKQSISYEKSPKYISEYIVDNLIEYPIMFNGKLKFKLSFGKEISVNDIKQKVLEYKNIYKYIDNINLIKKIIVIPQKIINIVTKK